MIFGKDQLSVRKMRGRKESNNVEPSLCSSIISEHKAFILRFGDVPRVLRVITLEYKVLYESWMCSTIYWTYKKWIKLQNYKRIQRVDVERWVCCSKWQWHVFHCGRKLTGAPSNWCRGKGSDLWVLVLRYIIIWIIDIKIFLDAWASLDFKLSLSQSSNLNI